jgi:thymidylate synthase ThyX
MIDYGHQSIADMAPIAMFIDGISMFMAYQVWAWSPLAGGQESSTRYIQLAPENLICAQQLGIPQAQEEKWNAAMREAFSMYMRVADGWQTLADAFPACMRLSQNLLQDDSPQAIKKIARMRRNYALDRARYWLPAAISTNVMLVMSARAWVNLCQHLCSSILSEAKQLGKLLREELNLGAPRLLRHAVAKTSIEKGLADEFAFLVSNARQSVPPQLLEGALEVSCPATAKVELMVPTQTTTEDFADALQYHDNRYAWFGAALRRTAVRFSWEAVAFGDIRDLNRHRSGTKFCPLIPQGFYGAQDQLPAESTPEYSCAPVAQVNAALKFGQKITSKSHALLAQGDPTYVYWTLLGTQFPFEHLTTADKFIYEAELRTGLGAHFRYAQHLHDALEQWYHLVPETRGMILEGTAEPE